VELAEKKNWKKIAFLSNELHLKRVRMLATAYNLKSQFISAETILRQFGNNRLIDNIEMFGKSPQIKKIRIIEFIYRIPLFIDKKGRSAKLLSQFFRK
jgi:uncharacterized SAM-binding protein YcdF (DUF218 family)